MAARKRTWTPEIVRQRIQAAQIVNRLSSHVMGKCKLSATQVTAALGLLKKCVPDLSSTTLANDDGSPLVVQVVKFGGDQDPSA